MRLMDFKMERENLVQVGDRVKVSEGELPSSWYYVVEPSVAMSANYKLRERLHCREGVVQEIKKTNRGYYVVVGFDE